MKTYHFALPDTEAAALDEQIAVLLMAFPDITAQDALVALLRMGYESIQKRTLRSIVGTVRGTTSCNG